MRLGAGCSRQWIIEPQRNYDSEEMPQCEVSYGLAWDGPTRSSNLPWDRTATMIEFLVAQQPGSIKTLRGDVQHRPKGMQKQRFAGLWPMPTPTRSTRLHHGGRRLSRGWTTPTGHLNR